MLSGQKRSRIVGTQGCPVIIIEKGSKIQEQGQTVSTQEHMKGVALNTPKKIVIATCGTRGDIQPLIALARALTCRGHKTLIAAPPEHGAWVADCGCAFHGLGSDFTKMLSRYPQVHTLKPVMGWLGFFAA